MRFKNRSFVFLVALASAAAAVAVFGTKRHRHHRRNAQVLEHRENLRSWENEGGNLASAVVIPAAR